uniref:Uncharacterized protein n=1 Tax=Fagus sylvatica TaxID=28930 RepID=A0A2N9G0V2_FAGSY
MASLAMAKSIRLSGLLGWDYGSKSAAAPDIGSRGCSCAFQEVVVVALFVGYFAVTNVTLPSM